MIEDIFDVQPKGNFASPINRSYEAIAEHTQYAGVVSAGPMFVAPGQLLASSQSASDP